VPASGVRARSDPITIGSIVVRIAVLVVTIHEGVTGPITDDLARFREIFLAPGTPYRAFPVEYAPGEVLFIRVAGSASPAVFATRLAVVAFIADLATWAALRWAWGHAPSTTYLLLGTPLLLFIYLRFDLVPVAIATWAAALALRGRERAAGIWFGAAILSKLWPVVVVPMLAVQERRRALWYAIASTAVALLVWMAISGVGAIRQVVTFRGATGWGVESSVGSVVWLVSGSPVRLEEGSPRVGSEPTWAVVALAAVLAAALVAIWIGARARPDDAPGAAALAAVAALLACSPLFSLQYAVWLLPWAAIASARGHRLMTRTTAAITVLTAALFIVYDPGRAVLSQVLLIGRNAAVIALPILWLASRHRVADPQPLV
jgi:glycosyl transferase family 87